MKDATGPRGAFDLDKVEQHEDGEALLDGLWEISAREPASWHVVELARRIVRDQH